MIVLFLLFSAFTPLNCEIEEVRNSFFNVDSEEELAVYLNLCKESTCQESEYYLAVATMWQAEYTYWPNKKYSYFNEGREMLEDLIKKNPQNVELRFLRYIVQSSCPPFLGYTGDIESDMLHIQQNIKKANFPTDHKDMILKTIDFIKAKK